MGEPAINPDEIDEERSELIDGEVVHKALPGWEHSRVATKTEREIGIRFDKKRRSDGTGGWWILSEISIQYVRISEKGRRLTADIAGWQRDKHPEKPKGFPVTVRPDWVCEISHSTRKKDSTIVPETLAADGVQWYWRFDVETENLIVYELSDKGYVQKMSLFREDGKVRVPPFETAEISMPVLLGEDSEDE